MSEPEHVPERRAPSLVVGPGGEPTAVIIDLETWWTIVQHIEDRDDLDAIRSVSEDLAAFRAGRVPDGWVSWDAFETELDRLEALGELPS